MKKILIEGSFKAVLVVLWALVIVYALDLAISIMTGLAPHPVVK